jgi:hypothetical protein
MSTKVVVFNDNSMKYKYLLQYLKEEGYEADVKDVNVASSLEERFDSIRPEGQKVFLPLSNEDLVKDNERLRQVIQGLESNGWRNLIVLPFEGMTDKSINDRVKTIEISDKTLLNTEVVMKDIEVATGEDSVFNIYEEVKEDKRDFNRDLIMDKEEVKEDKSNKSTARKVRDVFKK